MSEKYCQDCKHYLQHYGLDKRGLFQVYCGHCRLAWHKRKKPDTPACPQFTPGIPDADHFVRKEYLSKELLQYMLKMELLPEITDKENDPPQSDGS